MVAVPTPRAIPLTTDTIPLLLIRTRSVRDDPDKNEVCSFEPMFKKFDSLKMICPCSVAATPTVNPSEYALPVSPVVKFK